MNMDISGIGLGTALPTGHSYPLPSRSTLAAAGTVQSASTEEPVSSAVLKDLEKVGLVYNRRLRFSYDKDFGDVVVKVIDGDTDKVLREIPPKELQDLHIRIREAIGILFDKKA